MSLLFGLALCGVAGLTAARADDTTALATLAFHPGLPGDDLSPAFRLDARQALPPGLAERPSGLLAALARPRSGPLPPVRVHYPAGLAEPLKDANFDGVPDRVARTFEVAATTLRAAGALGLGAPADDGDGEIDLFLMPLGGAARGYAVQERPAPPGRGATGFIVADPTRSDDAEFDETIARLLARLIFAAQDAGAPAFWLEPSVVFLAERATGASTEMERCIAARWNHAERGPFAADPLLARGNVALLWSLDDPDLAGRALAATWTALAARPEQPGTAEPTAAAAIDGALQATLGLSLAELEVRAAVVEVASRNGPDRWAARVQALPVIEQDGSLPLAPLGLAFIRIAPDLGDPEGTKLQLVPGERGWAGTTLARRRSGGWDRAALHADPDGRLAITIPWNDYDLAVVILQRPPVGLAEGSFRIRAEAAERAGLYALSWFGAQLAATPGVAQISWSTAWEEGLFGWLVERATDPEGPWTSALATPVPALGLPHDGSEYIVQDELPRGRQRVFYRIVVLTTEGLRVTGPAVAVRAVR